MSGRGELGRSTADRSPTPVLDGTSLPWLPPVQGLFAPGRTSHVTSWNRSKLRKQRTRNYQCGILAGPRNHFVVTGLRANEGYAGRYPIRRQTMGYLTPHVLSECPNVRMSILLGAADIRTNS